MVTKNTNSLKMDILHISNASLSNFAEIVEDYKKGDLNREKAEKVKY